MINVAVLRGVGVVVRVGVRVMVGVLEAVGLSVGVLVDGGLGTRFKTEQACNRSIVVWRMSGFRIATLHSRVILIIPSVTPLPYRPGERRALATVPHTG